MEHNSREDSFVSVNLDFSIKNAIRPILGITTLFLILPAIIYCCSGSPETAMPLPAVCATKVNLSPAVRSMDVFVFWDDLFQKLDCYQRIDDMDSWNGSIVSGSGKRIITILANSPFGREDWFTLKSRFHLGSFSIRLEDERVDDMIMKGEACVSTGHAGHGTTEISLSPYASEIVLQSISCDFRGRPYAGEELSDVMVYLTNVNAESMIMDENGGGPVRIINAGGYNEDDMEAFACKEIIVQEITGSIGNKTIYPDIRLLCYRNDSVKESPGTPFTRLVIEGTLEGTRYYWPININRDTDTEAGIQEGHRYVYDIRITRKGSLYPDIPVKTEDIIINQEVSEWEEKKNYEVRF